MNAVLKPFRLTETPTLDELVAQWIEVKHAEDAANKQRVGIEESIIKLAGEPDEGSATHELADGSKLTITAKITRTIDTQAWRAVMPQIPENLRPIQFIETAKLDLKGARWLQENEPKLYAIVAQAITARKAKTAISVRV